MMLLVFINLLIHSGVGSAQSCFDYRDAACYDQDDPLSGYYFNCYGFESCVGSTIISTGMISCAGFNACQTSTLTAATYVYCGFDSCRSAFITAGSYLTCDSATSCYQLQHSFVTTDLTCSGQQSCREATITLTSTAVSVATFSGYRSGYELELFIQDSSTGTQTIVTTGEEALKEAHIYSGRNNVLNIYLRGYRAGDTADIHCETGSTCTVTCYDSACYNTQLICNSQATCSTNCINAPDSNYCIEKS